MAEHADTEATQPGLSLAGKLLIAMPSMQDPRFAHSVILLCSHNESGAMGWIVNKPSRELDERNLMRQNDIDLFRHDWDRPVFFGGPVETSRGFVLHTYDGRDRELSMQVTKDIVVTIALDIFEDIGTGNGPSNHILVLGFSGWGPGQLEAEILNNDWLTSDADSALIFDTPDKRKWMQALAKLGIDPKALSTSAGRA